MPLPEAYRSLLRPSSPDDAKASINCCNWFVQTLTILGVYLTFLYLLYYPKLSKNEICIDPAISSPPEVPPASRRSGKMVGPDGLEPSTPRLSSACSNQLSYEPKSFLGRIGFWLRMVEPAGFEPATPCLQSRCSAS